MTLFRYLCDVPVNKSIINVVSWCRSVYGSSAQSSKGARVMGKPSERLRKDILLVFLLCSKSNLPVVRVVSLATGGQNRLGQTIH